MGNYPVIPIYIHGYTYLLEKKNKLRTHMEDTSINGLVAKCTLLFKLAMVFNTLPCIFVFTWMIQQWLSSLSLIHGMEYLMHHSYGPIMYPRKNYQKKWYPASMFIQIRQCRNEQNSGIIQLPPYILWCRSCKRYFWQVLCNIISYPLQW